LAREDGGVRLSWFFSPAEIPQLRAAGPLGIDVHPGGWTGRGRMVQTAPLTGRSVGRRDPLLAQGWPGRPWPGSFSKPAAPCSKNRLRHLLTIWRGTEKAGGDLIVGSALSGQKDDLGAEDRMIRCRIFYGLSL